MGIGAHWTLGIMVLSGRVLCGRFPPGYWRFYFVSWFWVGSPSALFFVVVYFTPSVTKPAQASALPGFTPHHTTASSGQVKACGTLLSLIAMAPKRSRSKNLSVLPGMSPFTRRATCSQGTRACRSSQWFTGSRCQCLVVCCSFRCWSPIDSRLHFRCSRCSYSAAATPLRHAVC